MPDGAEPTNGDGFGPAGTTAPIGRACSGACPRRGTTSTCASSPSTSRRRCSSRTCARRSAPVAEAPVRRHEPRALSITRRALRGVARAARRLFARGPVTHRRARPARGGSPASSTAPERRSRSSPSSSSSSDPSSAARPTIAWADPSMAAWDDGSHRNRRGEHADGHHSRRQHAAGHHQLPPPRVRRRRVHRRRLGRDVRVRQPGVGRDAVRRRRLRLRGRRPRRRRRATLVRSGRVVAGRPARAQEGPAAARGADQARQGRPRADDHARHGQADRERRRRGLLSGRLLPLLRRGRRQGLRRGRADGAGGGHARHARADRRRRAGRAVELPDPDADLEARPGAGDRQLGRAQAGRAVAGRGARAGGARVRGRRARRRAERAAWFRRDRRAGARPPHGRRQDRVHRARARSGRCSSATPASRT